MLDDGENAEQEEDPFNSFFKMENDEYGVRILLLFQTQGCKFSDFNLISDFFTTTPLTTIFEISTF